MSTMEDELLAAVECIHEIEQTLKRSKDAPIEHWPFIQADLESHLAKYGRPVR